MKRLFNLFLAVVMIFSFTCIQVYAANGTGGSGNIDGGGGSMGDATSHGSWNPGNEGVRVTVVRASDHAVVTTPFDLTNKTPSAGIYHFGKVSKIQYNNGMVSLILQNLYREILTVADENGGRLKNRVVFFADELGTCPPIQSLELMFSASRSRGLMLVPIVQSITGQLQKNYGKEGSEIIVDNCQVNLYGGFAPASQTAVELSKSLGSRTVMSGSISRGKNDPSQSLQMMERPLMTPDELKSMPKGSFIVAKTGVHPMKVKLRLFLD